MGGWGEVAAVVMRCGGGWPAPSGCNLQRCVLLHNVAGFLLFRCCMYSPYQRKSKEAFPNFFIYNVATVTSLKVVHKEIK